MVKTAVKFESIEQVKNFVSKVEKYASDIDIKYGHIHLDGKSIEGLFALQFGLKLDCIIHTSIEDAAGLIEDIKEYTVGSIEEI